jgi:protein-S-isoprenylcysteine O-methyltransferase Ste14
VNGRGGGWVVAQFALMGLCFVAVVIPPDWPAGARTALSVVGAALALCGVALAVWASRALGRALTPYPRPLEGAPLVTSGPYALVRHPFYAAGLLFFVGWSLFAGPVALALTCLLALLWTRKAAVEEGYLAQAHPDYAAYAARVPRRLVPRFY